MQNYKTKDIFEASWLYSQQINLIGLEPDFKYFWFVFEDKDKCEKLSSDYWSRKANGNIKELVDSIKTLKDLVFSKSKGGYARSNR